MMYDPRHTTGISPVHKDVKHPLAYDPRRPGKRSPLHGNPGQGRTLLGLFIWLVILLGVLAVGLWIFFSVLIERAAESPAI